VTLFPLFRPRVWDSPFRDIYVPTHTCGLESPAVLNGCNIIAAESEIQLTILPHRRSRPHFLPASQEHDNDHPDDEVKARNDGDENSDCRTLDPAPVKCDADSRKVRSQAKNGDDQHLVSQSKTHRDPSSLLPRVTIDVHGRVRHGGHDAPPSRGMSTRQGIRSDLVNVITTWAVVAGRKGDTERGT
jgi:hypothetical protein